MRRKGDKSKAARQADGLHHDLLGAHRPVAGSIGAWPGKIPLRGGFISDWAVNISRGGIFINTRTPLSVGTTVRLIISLPDTQFPFELSGRVARVNEFDNPSNQVPGMGIEFVNVDDEKRLRIERFV